MYDDWPTTHVPVHKKSNSTCKPCDPGHNVLIGPLRPVMESHCFKVLDKMVVVRAMGLKAFPGACVRIEQKMTICGEDFFEEICACKENFHLCRKRNVITLTATGTYRVVLEGAEPADVLVTQHETDTGHSLGGVTTRGPF